MCKVIDLMNPIVTKHAKEKIKERAGLSKKISEKVAKKALNHGIKHSEISGRLKKYLDKLYLQHENANGMRIYNNKVFLFHGSVLITVINLPHQFIKQVVKLQQKNNIKENNTYVTATIECRK